MDMGDLDAAEGDLYIARYLSEREYQPVVRAEGRLYLEKDDPITALAVLEPARKRNLTDVDYWAMIGECHRRMGDPDRITTIHGMRRFKNHIVPELVVVHARALRDRGRLDEARAMVLDTLMEAPGDRALRAVAQEIGAI